MAIDSPDTDFQVMLYEIKPDGQSIALSVDRMRARYRESLKRETPVKPGELNQYEFKSFTFVCRRISKDSRLRLVITSPNSIFAEKNYNAGGVVTRESGKDSHVAHVTLYHDAQHPSRLDVPLGN
jgi:predicted acyl esterase